MSKWKMGNPKQKSRFICCRCLYENHLGDGIQRKQQREHYHVKKLYCLHCQRETNNMEIRFCDHFTPEELDAKLDELHTQFYGDEEVIINV